MCQRSGEQAPNLLAAEVGQRKEKWPLTLIVQNPTFSTSKFLMCFVDCVHLLLAHGAQVKVKNTHGWSPLAEAISYGDRLISEFRWKKGYHSTASLSTLVMKHLTTLLCIPVQNIISVTSLLRKLKQQSRETLESRRPALIQALKELGDFYLELKWDFHSWGKDNILHGLPCPFWQLVFTLKFRSLCAGANLPDFTVALRILLFFSWQQNAFACSAAGFQNITLRRL